MRRVSCIKFFRYVFIVITLVSQIEAKAYYKFERFSNNEGFNQNTIYAIEQDVYGILWFGTPNGLYRYDGYEFEGFTCHMQSDLSITNNFITCLHTDSLGLLWIGTREGVNVYIPWLEKFVTVPELADLNITYIHSDYQGRVWIGGKQELYVCCTSVDKNDVSFNVSQNFYSVINQQGEIVKFDFLEDDYFLLLSSSGLYAVEYDPTESSVFPVIRAVGLFELPSKVFVRSFKKVDNIFWIGTNKGLFKTTIEGDKIHIIEQYDNFMFPEENQITCIFEDNFGELWIGTTNGGLARYILEADSFEHFRYDPKNEDGISSKKINCIFQDSYNVLWLGTAQGGINKLDLMQKPFLNYAHNPYDKTSIPGDLVTSIMEDSKGYLWLSSFGVGICRSENVVDEESVENLKFESLQDEFPTSSQNVILSFYEDSKGYIWIGSIQGLFVYCPTQDKFKAVKIGSENSINLRRLRIVKEIDDEHLLFSGYQTVIVSNPWENIGRGDSVFLDVDETIEALGEHSSQCFLVDRSGDFWVGTGSGLFYVSTDNSQYDVRNVSAKDGDSLVEIDENIFSLLEDTEGNIWVGTFGKGLKKLNVDKNHEFHLLDEFTKNDLLPDDAIYGMIQEDSDHLWLSTDMGLCRLNISFQKTEKFDVRDGLPNNNFRQSAYFKGASGYFYFGGLNGLTVFKPEDIKQNLILPKVLITSLIVNDKKVKVGEELDGYVRLEKSILSTDKVTFKHNEQIIAFEVLVQHSNSPYKNKLQYKLEGFSDKWMLVEKGKTSITYTNLPPGDYVFRVKGANADGFWNDKSTDLEFTVLSPWYKTWWAYLILTLLVAVIIFAVADYYIKIVELTKNLKYEQLDKKRIDALNQTKLAFFTNISHEFRTPLTLISGSIEQLLERKTDDFGKRTLTIIYNNTKRLLRLVDQLITFRRAEQGYMQMNYSRGALGDFISPITEAFEEYGIRKNINFFYKILTPNEEVIIDVDKVERIFFNLLSNSFKYTPENGSISIESEVVSTEKGKNLVFKVIDNGKGIPPEKRDRIFNRFYQLEGREENVGGTGIGLALCKTLVDNMNGTIEVESVANVRTCFTVSIPCDVEDEFKKNKTDFVAKSSIKDWIPVQYQDSESKLSSEDDKKADYTILVVDDESEVRDFIRRALEGKYNVETVENGIQALDFVKLKNPNLIISDVMMPEMNGFELCKKIKSEEATCHIPVVLLTALSDNEHMIEGLEFGADDYISKPFSLKNLQLRISKLIDNNIKLKNYFQNRSSIPDPEIQISSRDRDFLNKIINSIEENISNSHFGVEELAKAVGISTAHFYRRLKQLTGQIPNVYLRNYRLERAAKIIKENRGDNITEIMYQVGFESNSYFSTAFKKLYGCSPSEYLKKGH